MRGADAYAEFANVMCGGLEVNPLIADMLVQSSRNWSRNSVEIKELSGTSQLIN